MGIFTSWRFVIANPFFLKLPIRYIHSSWIWIAPLFLITFYDRSVLEGITVLLLIILTLHLTDRVWDLLSTARTIADLTKDNRSFKKPVFRDFTDFFGDELGHKLDSAAPIYSVDIDNYLKNNVESIDGERIPLGECYLFQIIPNNDQAHIGNFALNITPNITFVFTSYDPSKLNPSRLLALLHELGHCSNNSWERRRSLWGAVIAGCLIFTTSFESFYIGLILSFYSIICLYRNYFRLIASRFWEELVADAITTELFTRVITTTELFKFTEKLLNPKRKLIVPEDSQLNITENQARLWSFRSSMRPSKENQDISEDLIDEVTKKHVRHSIFIAIFSAFTLYMLLSNFELNFIQTNELLIRLSVTSFILLIAIVATMLYLTKSVKSFFEFHLGIDAEKEKIRKNLAKGNLGNNALFYTDRHIPLAEAISGIQSFGRSTLKNNLDKFEDEVDQAINDMPEPVRDLNLTIIEFILSSPAYEGLKERRMGRPFKPEKGTNSEDRTAIINEWDSKLEAIGEYLYSLILDNAETLHDYIVENIQLEHPIIGDGTLFRWTVYCNAVFSTIGMNHIGFGYFKLKVINSTLRAMKSTLEETHHRVLGENDEFDEYFSDFFEVKKKLSKKFELHLLPLIHFSLYLTKKVEVEMGSQIQELLEELIDIQNKLMWKVSETIDGINMACDNMQKYTPDPKFAASFFLNEFSDDLKLPTEND